MVNDTIKPAALSLRDRVAMAKRHPQRVSVTISATLCERLQRRADDEGRSLSNLAAFLLESALSGDGGQR